MHALVQTCLQLVIGGILSQNTELMQQIDRVNSCG